MRLTVGKKLAIAFNLALAFLLAVGYLADRSSTELVRVTEEAEQSKQILAELDGLNGALTDVESASRGYVLDGSAVFLSQREASVHDARGHMSRLKALLATAPARLAQLESASTLIAQKLAQMKEQCDVRTSAGFEAGVRHFQTTGGRDLMEKLRSGLSRLQDDEHARFAAANRRAHGTADSTHQLLVFVTFGAVALMYAIGYLLTRQITTALRQLTNATAAVEAGRLDLEISVDTKDELSDLADAFKRMVEDLRGRAQAARQIAHGELDIQCPPRSDKDEFGTAFEVMIARLRAKVHQFSEIAEGNLSSDVAPDGERDQLGSAVLKMVANLRSIAKLAAELAAGNLKADVSPRNERDELGRALAGMTAQLRQLVASIQEVSHLLGTSANQILAASGEHEKIVSQQTSALSETTASVSELTRTQKQLVANTNSIAGLLQKTMTAVGQGRGEVNSTAHSLDEIHRKSQATSERIALLSTKVQQISKIVTTIREITEQINLLALNAAIEAARAGDQGRGFAVVATEVRRLAERTDRSTEDIVELIEAVQAATHTTVLSNEENLRSVATGVKSVEETVSVFGALQTDAERLSDAVEQAVLSIRQQEAAFAQIETAVQQISAGMNQSLGGTKENVEAARELTQLATTLRERTSRFRLE